jgi:hypothetical protein
MPDSLTAHHVPPFLMVRPEAMFPASGGGQGFLSARAASPLASPTEGAARARASALCFSHGMADLAATVRP